MIPSEHNIFTHFPKDQNCNICLRTKITRASCRRRTGTVVPRAGNFGDLRTADRNVLSEEDVRRDIIIDTLWLYKTLLLSGYNLYPCKSKTSQKTQKSLQKFLELTRKPQESFTLTIPWNLARLVKN